MHVSKKKMVLTLQERYPLWSRCVQKWSKTGRRASKLAQKASKGAKNGSKGVKMGQKGANTGQFGDVREGQNGGEEGLGGEIVMHGLLAHPLPCKNGLLSTRSGKGRTKIPFSVGSSS